MSKLWLELGSYLLTKTKMTTSKCHIQLHGQIFHEQVMHCLQNETSAAGLMAALP